MNAKEMNGYTSHSMWYWVVFITCFYAIHITSYFLYRVAAYYCKWKRCNKGLKLMFQEIVSYMLLTSVYFLATGHFRMFSCSVQHSMLEYGIPFLITLFTSGFLCEVPYLRVRLVDLKKWQLKTWIVYTFLVFIFLSLIILSFLKSDEKGLYFVPVIPMLLYFIVAFVITLLARNPPYRFHPRSYQLAFTLCLLRKQNDFNSRLLAAISAGVFLRCVSANPMHSILDEQIEDAIVERVPSSNNMNPSSPQDSYAISMTSDTTLTNPLLTTSEHAGNLQQVTVNVNSEEALPSLVNKQFLSSDEFIQNDEENENENENENEQPYVQSSRASDYGDWNDQQRNELLVDHA